MPAPGRAVYGTGAFACQPSRSLWSRLRYTSKIFTACSRLAIGSRPGPGEYSWAT